MRYYPVASRIFSRFCLIMLVLLLTAACARQARAQESRVLLVAPPGPAAEKVLLELARQLPRVTYISSRDSDIVRLARVPFSAQPLLALGTFAPDGRLQALTWQVEATNPKVAVAQLTAHLQDLATLPRLQHASLIPERESGPLQRGERLIVKATGTPASQVQCQIGDGAVLPMMEERPGFYVTSYDVRPEDSGETSVRVDLSNPRGSVSLLAGQARLEGTAAPLVEEVQQVATRRWVVSGRAAPDARITGTLRLEGRERQVETRSDSNGRFAYELETRRFLDTAQGELALTATSREGITSPAARQTLSFVGDQTFRPVRVRAVGGFGLGPVWGPAWGGGWGPAWGGGWGPAWGGGWGPAWGGGWGAGCGPWAPWGGGWGW